VGGKPTEVKVRSLVAWIAERRETETLMPIDKAILRMVSESSGRNESKCDVASKSLEPEAELSSVGRRQHGASQSDRCGGFILAGLQQQHDDKDMLNNWRDPPRPVEKSAEQEAV
jgi:hypothetical protein